MAKKDISREYISAIAENFEANEKDGVWNLDTMDAYVAFNHPEDIEKWAKDCSAINKVTRKDGKTRSDTKAVKKLFLETYFPEHTKEAIEARKKAKRDSKKKKDMTDEEKLIAKLKKLAEQ